MFYKFYLKSELGISVAYYNANSEILPSFKNSIYFEINLEKYSPFNIAFPSGIQLNDIQTFSQPVNKLGRFVRVKANNYGPAPYWHFAADNPSWIFADEVIVE